MKTSPIKYSKKHKSFNFNNTNSIQKSSQVTKRTKAEKSTFQIDHTSKNELSLDNCKNAMSNQVRVSKTNKDINQKLLFLNNRKKKAVEISLINIYNQGENQFSFTPLKKNCQISTLISNDYYNKNIKKRILSARNNCSLNLESEKNRNLSYVRDVKKIPILLHHPHKQGIKTQRSRQQNVDELYVCMKTLNEKPEIKSTKNKRRKFKSCNNSSLYTITNTKPHSSSNKLRVRKQSSYISPW